MKPFHFYGMTRDKRGLPVSASHVMALSGKLELTQVVSAYAIGVTNTAARNLATRFFLFKYRKGLEASQALNQSQQDRIVRAKSLL